MLKRIWKRNNPVVQPGKLGLWMASFPATPPTISSALTNHLHSFQQRMVNQQLDLWFDYQQTLSNKNFPPNSFLLEYQAVKQTGLEQLTTLLPLFNLHPINTTFSTPYAFLTTLQQQTINLMCFQKAFLSKQIRQTKLVYYWQAFTNQHQIFLTCPKPALTQIEQTFLHHLWQQYLILYMEIQTYH